MSIALPTTLTEARELLAAVNSYIQATECRSTLTASTGRAQCKLGRGHAGPHEGFARATRDDTAMDTLVSVTWCHNIDGFGRIQKEEQ